MVFHSHEIPCFIVYGLNVISQVFIFGRRIITLVTRPLSLLLGVGMLLVPIQQGHPYRGIVTQVAPESEDLIVHQRS